MAPMKPTKRNTNPIEFKIYTEILHRQNIMKTLKRKPIFTPLPIKVKQNSVIAYIMSEFAKKNVNNSCDINRWHFNSDVELS